VPSDRLVIGRRKAYVSNKQLTYVSP